MPANLAVERSSASDNKHTPTPQKPNDTSINTINSRSSLQQQQHTAQPHQQQHQQRRPSVTFDLPPARSQQPGNEHYNQQHRKRVSTHSKTSSIGSVSGQSITSSILSVSSSSNSPGAVTSPIRRQLKKRQRASTVSTSTVSVSETTSSATMRFGMKLDFNKRSSKRISQDSFSKELPPLPHEALNKRVSGQLPPPPFGTSSVREYANAPAALLSPRIHETDVLHIKNNARRRSSLKSRTDLPPLPSDARPNNTRHARSFESAQHLAEVKRQTELWLSMLNSDDNEGDYLFTPSLSSSSSNSSLNGKTPAPSSDCCDPEFLVAADKAHSKTGSQLPLPYTSPILPSPFTDNIAQPLNPFEASFMASRDRQSTTEAVLPSRRRSSLPTHLLTDSSSVQKRSDKHRPPPLTLAPVQDSPAEESASVQTAIPAPQYRSRSLSHDLRPLDPLSLYHRRFHRSSQDTTDLSASTSRSRENSISSSSAASMIFTSSNDSSIDNSVGGRRFSSATSVSSSMPSPKSPNHPRTPTLQDLLEEGPCREDMETGAVKDSKDRAITLSSSRHMKQGSTGSVEVVMYGVAR